MPIEFSLVNAIERIALIPLWMMDHCENANWSKWKSKKMFIVH